MWNADGLEIVEFTAADGLKRRLTRTLRDGSKRGYAPYAADEVQFVPDVAMVSPNADAVLRYFRRIVDTMDADDDPIVRAFSTLDYVHPESALARYSTGTLLPGTPVAARVFPFQSNLSQQSAIDRALTHSTSIIEGPPGTGKTETILNLISNIVTEDRGTVAVISFSNAAVDNVAEKLQQYGFGHIVAELGNREKLSSFFAGQAARNVAATASAGHPLSLPDPRHLADLNSRVRRLQTAERERAEARALLGEYELEHQHFERHRGESASIDVDRLPLLRRPASRILEFLAEAAVDEEFGLQPGLLRRIGRFFRYGRIRDIDSGDVETVVALQAAYYRRRIDELRAQVAVLDNELVDGSFDALGAERQQRSLETFTASVASRLSGRGRELFTERSLRDMKSFRSFIRDYPVVLSTCHSLRRNIPPGYLFDYLMIDEASQVDLLSAALAMSACRNLIIVGDRRQLPQISKAPTGLTAPSPAYDYGTQSILSSIRTLYGDAVPSTLLREHYRCHPAIIGFCNQAFYDRQLIPYTRAADTGAPAMRVLATVRGNHMRQHRAGGKTNQREIDVVLEEVLPSAPAGIGPNDIAFAAPFRRQVSKAAEQLSDRIDTIDTVHRLQGRQKRMVVLTTVLSETWQGSQSLRFVDDPRLINVAVSRAVDSFVLVTNFDQLPKSRYIRDLIGYIQYQYPDQPVGQSDVLSVFDLLYRDYDARLSPLAARLRDTAKYRSEEIIRVLLDDILADNDQRHLRASAQVHLRSLVPQGTRLTDAQAAFARRTSSVDFVIFNAVTKQPVLAIEVDGFAWHENNPAQTDRDALKDSILERVGLRLLRLRTTESREEGRIRDAIAAAQA